VVIAIIAILAAILFPVFAQAKLAAKKTVALSNAKQIATANFIYMGDADDALIKEFFGFPPAPACSAWGNTYYSWRYAMQPYVAKSNGLLQDPTNPFMAPQYWQEAFTDGVAADHVVLPQNYAVNNALIGFANGQCAGIQNTPPGLDSLNNVDSPADTIVMLANRSQWNDLKLLFISPKYDGGTPGWCLTAIGGSSPTCPTKGNGPINANGKIAPWIFADGHAKGLNVIQTLQTNLPTTDMWGSKYYTVNPIDGTTNPISQAQRIDIAANAYPEYK